MKFWQVVLLLGCFAKMALASTCSQCGQCSGRGSSGGGESAGIALTTSTAMLASSGDNNTVTTPAITTTGSNLITVGLTYYRDGVSPVLSDSKSNFWTCLTVHQTATLIASKICYSTSPVVGTNHTFTYSGATLYASIAVAAWSGAHATDPFDKQNGAASNSATTIANGIVTPTEGSELVVTSCGSNANGSYSLDAGTVLHSIPTVGGQAFGIGFGYQIRSPSDGGIDFNPSWTNSGAADEIATSIATFKKAP